jgi:hypothetical protein
MKLPLWLAEAILSTTVEQLAIKGDNRYLTQQIQASLKVK